MTLGRRLVLALTAGALIALALAASAHATITVANQNDSGTGSLRQALVDAAPGETIVVPPGTYTLTSEPLSITKGLTIAGAGQANTTVRAGGQFRVITASPAIDLTISGMTIRDGDLVQPGGLVQGGGINAAGARLVLRDVSVTHNTADADGPPGMVGGLAQGGGIWILGGSLTLIGSTVSENAATANGGSGEPGGLAQGGGIWTLTSLTVSNSTVGGNRASVVGGQGPAGASQSGGLAQGGGIFALIAGESHFAASGLTVGANSGDASGGPGAGGGMVQGGGLFAVTGTPATLTEATIGANVARADGAPTGFVQGGGLFASVGESSPLALLSDTLGGNRAEPSTLSEGAGDFYLAGPATVRNSIVAAGAGATGNENCKTDGKLISLGFNMDSLDQCGFHAGGDRVNTDPLLGPLTANGGPTPTMLPAPDSPALDQGSASGLTADQRAVVRPIDLPSIPNSSAPGADGSDIGAVELQPSNAFSLGKLTRNQKKGTATLTVLLPKPSAGTLALTGKGLRPQTAAIAGQTEVKLKVIGRGGVKKALRKKGRRKVRIDVTYAPLDNAAATATRKAKLVRKHRKHKRKRSTRSSR